MKSDLALHCKQTLLPGGFRDVTVLITEGIITGILEGKAPQLIAKKFEEAGESVLMPGLIDCHVHINEPGRTEWEGFETATKAAAAGGITTLVDMPLNSTPVTTTVLNFQKKLRAAKGKLFVNCGFWGGIVPGNTKDLEPLIKAGVLGFKAFLTHSGIDDFPNAFIRDLEKAAPVLKRYNVPLLVHAELDTKHKGLKELDHDPSSYLAFLHSHPKSWEDHAISAMITFCEKYHVRTHIVHLSSADSLSKIAKAKIKNLPLTVETCPHYLFFEAEKIPDSDTRFKCAPPIREKENNLQLWNGLKEGVIDFVVTDHSPAPPDIKEIFSGNLKDALEGIASLQFSLPVMCTLALKHGASVEDISRWMSGHVAGFLGLANKGRIDIGADADLVIWNPKKKMKVTKHIMQSRHRVSPYEDLMLSGMVEKTYVAGIRVYDRGSFVSSPTGKVILRKL